MRAVEVQNAGGLTCWRQNVEAKITASECTNFTFISFVKYRDNNMDFYENYINQSRWEVTGLVYLWWQVNDGEIQQRRRYLEQQRDGILAHKKC